ncbi:MAG: RsmB/NOP family class I SAM-dependent RNA methyltransferase [Halocynthiibacter sp.]
MSKQGLETRKAALRVMNAIMDEGRLMSDLMTDPRIVGKLADDERARLQRQVTLTLRYLDRADRFLGPHLKKRPSQVVHNVLRLGVVEILEMNAAAHGVVDGFVTVVRSLKDDNRASGFVNAVLRKADGADDIWAALPVPRLPKWLRKPMQDAYGKAVLEDIERAHMKGAPLDISVKSDAAKLAEAIGGDVLPTGTVRFSGQAQVSKMPGFATGDWWVQDVAAALPAKLAGDVSGLKVLDLCAAPGGKTMQLAARGADVTALDVSARRLKRLEENLTRTKLKAKTIAMDALEFEGGPFDVILLDAPCSATGTIRRHPDLPYAKDGSEFMGLFELQEYLIDRALGLLKPNGRLIYCTCSLFPDEGEVQIEEALARHETYEVAPLAFEELGLDPAWQTEEGGLRLRPDYWADKGGMDGFYIAILQQKS